ncbi:alcohol dehydrogenase catalytic domain-containing protein [Variovorax humicola]|uniref:Alcohol dehydrogenase catalytic domain-containing protein n=1 Tax=Variovorax humicola TaxID=1769758 RepID=A0ABU8W361_9BURK
MNTTLAPVPETMVAARLHAIGEPLKLDRIPVPKPRAFDVLVQVTACGIVPNMRRVIGNFFGTQMPDAKLFPNLPAIFGLDPVGVVAEVGEFVTGVKAGERVYVNPARSCGSCRMCRTGRSIDCPVFTFQGYFGRSRELMQAYPYGGFSQYITAPSNSLVKLPASVKDEEAGRLGYLGTAYGAMKRIHIGPGEVILINGISGTLGLCATLIALAMGATKILGTGRNVELLERVKAIAPHRIFVHAVKDMPDGTPDPLTDPLLLWAREQTGGWGVDGMIDCLPPGAPASTMLRALHTLRRGGMAVNVGAVSQTLPLNAFWLCANRIALEGSVWFSTAEGEEMAAMAAAGSLDLTVFNHRRAPMSKIDEVLEQMSSSKDGGFANYVIDPAQVD